MSTKPIIYTAFAMSCIVCACDSDSSVSKQSTCLAGQVFDAQSGECRTLTQCEGDEDCKGGRKCIAGSCKDVQTTECSGDDDCKGTMICRNEHCVTECSEDEDCAGSLVCRQNRCTIECQSKDDCDGDYVCKSGSCLPECQGEEDCDAPAICIEQHCKLECREDTDCNGDLVCRGNRCKAECVSSDDCDDDEVCSKQKCIPACESKSDCEPSELCEKGECIPDPTWCTYDDECDVAAGIYCSQHHCRDPRIECYEDTDCEGIYVCKANRCAPECYYSTDCKDNLVCRGQQCKPECLSNSDCTLPAYCKDSRCTLSCENNDDCVSPYICKSKQCAAECTKSSECSGSMKCSEMRCVECIDDSDCTGSDMVCQSNTCQNSKDVRYPCLIKGDGFDVYKTSVGYNAALNNDGSIDLCKLGYYPSQNEIAADPSKDTCLPLYTARMYDFYGDGVDSNCDGYDYNLKDAIFVYKTFQGGSSGNDDNSGKYNASTGVIEAKATLKSALHQSATMYRIEGGSVFIYPDIIVSADVFNKWSEPLVLSALAGNSPADLLQLKEIPSASGRTAYRDHQTLVKEILSDSGKRVSDYGFYTEGDHPTERIRIFGGLTRNPLNDDNNLHWQHQEGGVSKVHLEIPSIDRDTYVMISQDGTASASFALHDFEMSMSTTAKALPQGTTFVGFSCGSLGCAKLNLNRTKWTIHAPDGVSQSSVLSAGEAGLGGKDGVRYVGHVDEYVSDTWCTKAQVCGGSTVAGKGGCGGHVAKSDDGDGESSSNYDRSNYRGEDGQRGQNGESVGGSSASGGSGGSGLASAGLKHTGCDGNSGVDPDKGTGGDGNTGENGRNGSHQKFKFTLKPAPDGSTLYFASNYNDLSELYGADGAQGGGGGGGAVYQAFTSQWANGRSWISAGSGGNGGCGGKGGQPGGTGGSAIGILFKHPATGNAQILLEATTFDVFGGSGGKAQSGSKGGAGGAGGDSIGYANETISYDLFCDKATAGGKGGNGGGGGAGAGGVAGEAVSFVFTCGRDVVEDCRLATLYTPCFTESDRMTIKNCGYDLPSEFLYNVPLYGSQTPGKTYADSTDNVAGQGSRAGTEQTEGSVSLLKTWIGSL